MLCVKVFYYDSVQHLVSSHSGSRQKFGSLFVQTGLIDKESGKLYSELFEKRQKGDYNDFFDFDYETVVRLYGPAKKLILGNEIQIVMAPFYDDDGIEIDPEEIRKPSLCVICKKDSDPDEEIVCTLTRMDQRNDEDFICEAFERI